MGTRPHIGRRILDFLRRFLRKHWQYLLRIREKLGLSEEAFHLLLAGGVGVIGGCVKLGFVVAGDFLRSFVLGSREELVFIADQLHWWQGLLTPALGGLVAGLILFWGLKSVRKQGPGNLMEATVAGDGRMRLRPSLFKSISSMFSINTGASIGQEGAISQMTSTLASKWGQFFHWQPYRLRLLVACGAAAGIAAAYNAPIAGAVFAAQIILGNFSMSIFAPLVFASVVAAMMSRSFFGMEAWFQVPEFYFDSVIQLPWFLVLGILCGALGAGFLQCLRVSEKWFSFLAVPLPFKLALGGLAVGGIGLWFPEAWGNGYNAANLILHEQLALDVLFALFAAKFLAIVATVGSGAVGGVFTPTLFVGAGVGGLFGSLMQMTGWPFVPPVGVFAIVGMGGVLASTTHSPLLAMIMIFEISLNYSLMPPLMLACVVSTLVARGLHPDSVYTQPLRRKGVAAGQETELIGAGTYRTVGDLMREPVPPLRETATLRQIADYFLTSPYNFLTIVDAENRLMGMVALQDLKEHLHTAEEWNLIIAYDVMRPASALLTPNQSLLSALPTLLGTELRNVPVVNSTQERRLVGNLSRAEALGLMSEAISARELR